MIAWLNPVALAALATVALPILVHLLVRRRAPRVLFPSLRFLAPSDQSAVRIRVPSEWLLLLVRVAIVACAALAVARPLLMTDGRRTSWAQRTVRAIVVDTSPSVNSVAASEGAVAEAQGAVRSRRFDGADVGESLRRAAAWLAASEPALREVVVLSDFQRGAMAAADVSALPAAFGFRPVRVTARTLPTTFDGEAVLAPSGALLPRVTVAGDATTVTWQPAPIEAGSLHIEAPADVAARLRRAVSEAGALAPPAGPPTVVRFGEGVAPDSLEAATILQSTLNARRDPQAWAERDPQTIAAPVLDGWTRTPSLPPADAWRHSDESDGRWLWLAAILLLLVEAVVRRSAVAVAPAREDARAA